MSGPFAIPSGPSGHMSGLSECFLLKHPSLSVFILLAEQIVPFQEIPQQCSSLNLFRQIRHIGVRIHKTQPLNPDQCPPGAPKGPDHRQCMGILGAKAVQHIRLKVRQNPLKASFQFRIIPLRMGRVLRKTVPDHTIRFALYRLRCHGKTDTQRHIRRLLPCRLCRQSRQPAFFIAAGQSHLLCNHRQHNIT